MSSVALLKQINMEQVFKSDFQFFTCLLFVEVVMLLVCVAITLCHKAILQIYDNISKKLVAICSSAVQRRKEKNRSIKLDK